MNHVRGFSLVELSIVLVILGLLTGGILAGQSLVRASELRSISNEFTGFQTALHSFRDKYFDMPGDMSNATKFFGRMTTDSACSFTVGAVVTDSGVCNGTGDGQIGAAFGGTGNISEEFQVWRHLMAAQLIQGNLSGRYVSGSGDCDPAGTNCPSSRVNGGQWFLSYRYSPWTLTEMNHYFSAGKSLSGGTTSPNSAGGIMKPEEVWNIDSKMDDGVPGVGLVRLRSTWPQCHSGAGSTATYLLSLADKTCYIEFRAKV